MYPNEQAEDNQQPLEKYGLDFTQLARDGKLDPVIGRDQEVRRTMQILSRRTKNNPVLIGEPGVGKTAIIEGLAQKIIKGDAPSSLRDKRLISLEVSSLLAGASFKGQFEERVKAVLKEIEDAAGEIILFIDEIHTIVGAGGGGGSVDVANMLKPMLARGQLRLIGATTIAEYHKYIETDAALERRMQPVMVEEPSVEDTIAILRGIQEKYEVHHGVKITDDAIVSAAKLSDRYITGRFLPDKAIDLIDEATSGLKMQLESMPIELDQLKHRIMQLEIEQTALKKDKSPRAVARKTEIEAETKKLKTQAEQVESRWQQEKDIIDEINSNTEQIDKLNRNLELAEREADLALASKIKYGELPEAQKQLQSERDKLSQIPETDRLLRQEVTSHDVADVLARWTGIRVNRLLETESQKLKKLELSLGKRVIGQEDAIKAVANAVRRARSGINDPQRPDGSFLFLGATGVGKTELARALSEQLFDDETNMIRIDMSEYLESHTISRLIGSPPGYVGYDQGGQLTEAVRRHPYSVVLFDEIEKAHPDVLNVLLQVLDDGRLTDGQGRTVDFSNVIIIMTSNVASELTAEYSRATGDKREQLRQQIDQQMRRYFKPEFLNRIDDIVIFNNIAPDDMGRIVDGQLARLAKELASSKDFHLKFTESLKKYLAETGFSLDFGARPLKRLIQKTVQDELALAIIDGKIKDGDSVVLDYQNKRVVLKVD